MTRYQKQQGFQVGDLVIVKTVKPIDYFESMSMMEARRNGIQGKVIFAEDWGVTVSFDGKHNWGYSKDWIEKVEE